MTTRRDILTGGVGLAAILASGKAPAYIIKSMLAARNSIGMRAGGAKLPYDAEVEYIRANGTQYINTGILPTQNTVAKIDISMTDGRNVFGSLFNISSRPDRCMFGLTAINANTMQLLVVAANGVSYTISASIKVGEDFTGRNIITIKNGIAADYSDERSPGWREMFDVVGDVSVSYYYRYNTSGSEPSFENALPLYIFGRRRIVASSDDVLIANGTNTLYGLRIFQGSLMVRDFIPVRFTNEQGVSEGAIYDRVSGQLFRNQGTGAFLWGHDASAQNGGGV